MLSASPPYAQGGAASGSPSRSPTNRQPTPPSLSLPSSQSRSSTSSPNTRETPPNISNAPEPPARSSHAVQLPGERSATASHRSLSFGRSLSSRAASEELGEPRSLTRSASAGSTLRQARKIAGVLATEGAREAQDDVDQRVVRLTSGSPPPRSPRSVSTAQVVGVTQNYMQRRNSFGNPEVARRNSFGKYTASPMSVRSPSSSFGRSSNAGSEAAKHSEGMRLAVASALATVLPDVMAAEALGEGRRLGARETAHMASNPQMMAHALGLLHDELGELETLEDRALSNPNPNLYPNPNPDPDPDPNPDHDPNPNPYPNPN